MTYRGALFTIAAPSFEVLNTLPRTMQSPPLPPLWVPVAFPVTHHNTESDLPDGDKFFVQSADFKTIDIRKRCWAQFRGNAVYQPRAGMMGVGEVQLCFTAGAAQGALSISRPDNMKVLSYTTADFGTATYTFECFSGTKIGLSACYYGSANGPPIDLIGAGFQVQVYD